MGSGGQEGRTSKIDKKEVATRLPGTGESRPWELLCKGYRDPPSRLLRVLEVDRGEGSTAGHAPPLNCTRESA